MKIFIKTNYSIIFLYHVRNITENLSLIYRKLKRRLGGSNKKIQLSENVPCIIRKKHVVTTEKKLNEKIFKTKEKKQIFNF